MDSTHGTAGKVPQYFNKATWGCIWSSQINTGARHGKEMAVKVVHKVRDTWQGHEVAFYIALGLGYRLRCGETILSNLLYGVGVNATDTHIPQK